MTKITIELGLLTIQEQLSSAQEFNPELPSEEETAASAA